MMRVWLQTVCKKLRSDNYSQKLTSGNLAQVKEAPYRIYRLTRNTSARSKASREVQDGFEKKVNFLTFSSGQFYNLTKMLKTT